MVQTIETRLIQAIQKQAEKVVYYCSAETVLPDLAIHEIRKSFKRMRALLKFYPLSSDEIRQSFSKEMVVQAKILTTARESFVNIQLFDIIERDNKLISRQKLEAIKDLLVEKNKEIVRDFVIDRKKFVEIHSFILDLEANLYDLILHPSNKIDIPGQINSSYEKGYNLFQKLDSGYDAVLFHDLRKKVKILWYQIDFAKHNQPTFFKLKANELRKIADQLGDDHDWCIFQTEIKQNVYNLETSEIEILEKQIGHLHNLNFHRLIARLRKFFVDPRQTFGEKVNTIYQISDE